MSRASLWLISLAAAILVACGSRSPLEESGDFDSEDETDDSPANGGSSAAPSDNGGSGPAPGTNGGAGGSAGAGDTLPECVLGPARASPQASDVECNWVVSDRCYERRIEACACACPRDRNSNCVSGLPDREVAVTCS
ncbi:MAG: hypothetical protein ABW217_14785 [Polyangiaceae bacterium]